MGNKEKEVVWSALTMAGKSVRVQIAVVEVAGE
jgi:hypothetical protein